MGRCVLHMWFVVVDLDWASLIGWHVVFAFKKKSVKKPNRYVPDVLDLLARSHCFLK